MTNEEIKELKEEMCDNYCRMTDFYAGDALEDICRECPLNRLEADE